jgi:hypothetical protein
MMTQRDGNTVVITLTLAEVGQLPRLATAADMGQMFAPLNPEETALLQQLASVPFTLTDAELVEAMIEPHLAHEGDDVVAMRAELENIVPEQRKRYLDAGLIAG